MKLQDRITGKITGLLSAVRDGRSKGKSLDSPEVCEPLQELANEIGHIMLSELKLSEKFELGNKRCVDVLKEETLVDDMIDFCLQNKNTLSPISDEEKVMWTFFMAGTIFSSDLSRKLSKSKLLEYGKDILEATHDSYESKWPTLSRGSILGLISHTTHNMCTFCDVTITDVRAAGYLPVFLKYLESDVVKNDLRLRIPILAAASDVMNEHDASMAGSRDDVEYMICGIEEAIRCVSGQFNGWFAFELAKTATKTLAHLAFDDENKKTFVSDTQTDVVTTLFDLARSSRYPDVRGSAKGVLWTLSEQLHSSTKYADLVQELFGKKTKGHVMISYSREQRPLLLRIKQAITEAGFSVWMDIEQMRENVYDRMAEAIQDASVVLISMSYSYQRSEYCRREAAYASSLKKDRIPLLVDPGFTADGWLALMTAGDYHYDFVRKPFETKIVELIKELERRCVKSPGDTTDGVSKQVDSTQQSPHAVSSHGLPGYNVPSAHGQIYSSSPLTHAKESVQCKKHSKRWKKFSKLNQEQFMVWLEKQHLPRDIFESYRAKDIVFFAQMKEESPDNYYKHVMKLSKTKNKVEAFKMAADFTKSLEHLKITKKES
ncbi:uncharacterized protein LOC128183203 isoform X2 [Crassostrea angulata]|uniref:uncharacterized protein LOC128183203 isoform X2 n=1 Tax=Magallana angulata TaxID=2784310 RepID=UPI0022B14F8B|nr:uncharacterized protein LOC128183203 isoform X2 [Crassostrea angulata]